MPTMMIDIECEQEKKKMKCVKRCRFYFINNKLCLFPEKCGINHHLPFLQKQLSHILACVSLFEDLGNAMPNPTNVHLNYLSKQLIFAVYDR
jgi:hypothetical protein